MRILFIHNRYKQPGGEDTALELETALLQQKGHELMLLEFHNDQGEGVIASISAGLNSIYNGQSAATVKHAILSFQPQVIHVHNFFFKASPSVFFAAKRLGVPVVMTLHNYRLICANALLLRDGKPCELCTQQAFPFSGIRYRCYRHSAMGSAAVTAMTGIHKKMGTWRKKIDRYIVLTEFARNKMLHSSLRCADSAFLVKPNFVPDNGVGALPRKDFYLFVGRITSEKGIGVLGRAFAALPGTKLVIAGEGPDKNILAELLKDHPGIVFTGSKTREEILELMKQCKALIFPSIWYEGLPFVILEAFSTGTPVIASNTGSMMEMIRDGYNGYHFAAGDSAALQKIIDRFNNDSATNLPMYENARKTWLQFYQPEVHYSAVLKLYEEVIEAKQANL